MPCWPPRLDQRCVSLGCSENTGKQLAATLSCCNVIVKWAFRAMYTCGSREALLCYILCKCISGFRMFLDLLFFVCVIPSFYAVPTF